jgi:hypothetical protein
MQGNNLRWFLLFAANIMAWGMLGFNSSSSAQNGGQFAFPNPADQSNQVIHELKEIKTLLQEQNNLLRANAGAGKTTSPSVPKYDKQR